MVGNDSSPHLKMFDEVSKTLCTKTSEISKNRSKFRLGYFPNILTTYQKYQFFNFR